MKISCVGMWGGSAYHREGPEPCTTAGGSCLAASTPASFCSSGEREKKTDFCDSSQRLGLTRDVRWRRGRTAEGRANIPARTHVHDHQSRRKKRRRGSQLRVTKSCVKTCLMTVVAGRILTRHNEEVGYSRRGSNPSPDFGLITGGALDLWPRI